MICTKETLEIGNDFVHLKAIDAHEKCLSIKRLSKYCNTPKFLEECQGRFIDNDITSPIVKSSKEKIELIC